MGEHAPKPPPPPLHVREHAFACYYHPATSMFPTQKPGMKPWLVCVSRSIYTPPPLCLLTCGYSEQWDEPRDL